MRREPVTFAAGRRLSFVKPETLLLPRRLAKRVADALVARLDAEFDDLARRLKASAARPPRRRPAAPRPTRPEVAVVAQSQEPPPSKDSLESPAVHDGESPRRT
jgi:hypothetical protein